MARNVCPEPAEEPARQGRFSIREILPPYDPGSWPQGFTVSREQIYDDMARLTGGPEDSSGDGRPGTRGAGSGENRRIRGFARRRPLTGMFIDADVLVAARFITAPAHVAACRCLDRAGDNEEPMRIGRRIVRDRLLWPLGSSPGRMVEGTRHE